MKKKCKFWVFLGDVISGVGLGFLAKVIGPCAPTTRWKYFT